MKPQRCDFPFAWKPPGYESDIDVYTCVQRNDVPSHGGTPNEYDVDDEPDKYYCPLMQNQLAADFSQPWGECNSDCFSEYGCKLFSIDFELFNLHIINAYIC